ncbi:MAG: 50S ribosome-binding GTPase, partial [Saprospiraceae bacterium]|nr:50S ribosome-binding GTPase [Saprospiraceae bacterium]
MDSFDGMTVAIVGNPNSGKTSLFNALTGSNQRTGNFPGVTVERKTGKLTFPGQRGCRLIDLPGAYSLYPNSSDERIAAEILIDPGHVDHPDLVVYVADAKYLDKQLLLLSQVLDLGFPTMLVLSMIDELEEKGKRIDVISLQRQLQIPVISISSRKKMGLLQLREQIEQLLEAPTATRPKPVLELHKDAKK